MNRDSFFVYFSFNFCSRFFFSPLKCTLYWSRTKYSAKISVWLKHCSTAFIKHVLPWFCKPITPGTRSGGQAFNGGTRPFVVVLLVVVCLACAYKNKQNELEKKFISNDDDDVEWVLFDNVKFSSLLYVVCFHLSLSF